MSRLKEITAPVLIVHGQLDATWKVDEAEAIHDALVNATVKHEVIENSGLMVVWLRDSSDVSHLIEDFAKEVASE